MTDADEESSGDRPGAGDATPDTREAIMEATYEAINEHGYADLTIQRIADEFDKSKSLLYYHYDAKEDILTDFFDYLLEQFAEELDTGPRGDPETRLRALLDTLLPVELDEDERAIQLALVQMRAQAPHTPPYYEGFRQLDDFLLGRLRDVIANGVADGVFREVDPDVAARTLFELVTGGILRRVTTDADVTPSRAAADAYVEETLLA